MQQFRMNLEIQIGQFLEKIGQIGVWLQAIGLTCLDDAVNCGTGLCSFGRSAEQPVLPAYGEGPDGPLTDIVRHGSFSIFQVGTQLLPVEESVLDGFAQRRFQARLFIHFRFQPRKVSLQLAFFKPQTFFFPLFRIQYIGVLLSDAQYHHGAHAVFEQSAAVCGWCFSSPGGICSCRDTLFQSERKG